MTADLVTVSYYHYSATFCIRTQDGEKPAPLKIRTPGHLKNKIRRTIFDIFTEFPKQIQNNSNHSLIQFHAIMIQDDDNTYVIFKQHKLTAYYDYVTGIHK